jgi:hypothetical protein
MRDMRACNRCAERTFLNKPHLTNNHSIFSAAHLSSLSKHVYIILRANGIESGLHELTYTYRLDLARWLKPHPPGFCLLSSCSKHSTCSRQVAVSRRLRSETYIHMHTTPSLRANATCSMVILCFCPSPILWQRSLLDQTKQSQIHVCMDLQSPSTEVLRYEL